VAILAILAFIAGLVTFIGGLGVLLVFGVGAVATFGGLIPGLSGVASGVAIVILGLITMGVAVGIWRLRMWAWWVMVILMLANIAFAAVAQNWLGLVLPVIIFLYLLAVRGSFRAAAPAAASA